MAAQQLNPGPASRAAVTAALATSFDGEIEVSGGRPVQFRPDGRAVVTGGPTGSLDLWDLAPGAAFRHAASLPVGKDIVHVEDAAFSPDGNTLVAGDPGGLRLWDVRLISTPRLLGDYRLNPDGRVYGPAPNYWSVSFAPDGTGLLVDNGLATSLWRLQDGRAPSIVWKLTRPPSNVNGLFASPTIDPGGNIFVRTVPRDVIRRDGHTVDNDLTVWRLRGSTKPLQLTTLPGLGDEVQTVSFTPDGKLMTLTLLESVALYDMSNPARPKPVGSVKPSSGEVITAALNRTGTLLALGQQDNTVDLWDIRTRSNPTRTATLVSYGPAVSAQFTPDSTRLLTAVGLPGHTIMRWRVDTPLHARHGATLLKQNPSRHVFPEVGISAEDTVLAFTPRADAVDPGAGRPGELTSWNISNPARPQRTGKPRALVGGIESRVGIGTGTQTLLAAGRVWRVSGTNLPKRILPPPTPDGNSPTSDDVLDMDSAGQLAAVRVQGVKLQLYRLVGAGKPLPVSPLPASELTDATFTVSGDGLVISASGPLQPSVEYWDLRDPVHPHRTASLPIDSPAGQLAIDKSGTRVAFHDGRDIKLWNIGGKGKPIQIPTRLLNNAGLTSLAMSPDGAVLAIATTDRTELWSIVDQATPMLLHTIPGNGGRLAFSPDRPLLVIAGSRETALWDVARMISVLTDPMAEACRISAGPTQQEWQYYAASVRYQNVCK
jgi:WD40 repeat protein